MARASVMLTVVSCLALMMLGTDAARSLLQGAVQTCGPQYCPNGYTAVPVPNRNTETWKYCSYSCATPAKLNCFPKNLLPSSSLYASAVKASQPYVCGGTDYNGKPGRPCPSISCGYASTYAVSASGGCSYAKANIDALAISKTNFDLKNQTMEVLNQYCDALNNDVDVPLESFAYAAADAAATQIVNTIAHYSVYLCQCACGTLSAGYGVVKADIQSAANATATAWALAIASVNNNCTGNSDLLAFALQYSEAVATAVETAIDSVYFKYVSQAEGYKTCISSGVQTEIKTAVARALVCVYAEAFAASANAYAYEPGVNSVSYSCGSSISISGSYLQPPSQSTYATCRLTRCDCNPKAQGYNNAGFETGVFAGYRVLPEWDVNTNECEPEIKKYDYPVCDVGPDGPKIRPSEGEHFAVVKGTVNPGTSSITTTINVPPCASKIQVDWIFKCNDYASYANGSNTDSGRVTITATNVVTEEVFTATAQATCKAVGKCGLTIGNIVGKPYWSTLTLGGLPTGDYSVVVKAVETNDYLYRSDLYVDNLRYSA